MPVSIMLDAGHGGRDPGAVYNGRQEKDDVLKLVLAIGEILQNSGIDVEYTRTTDIYETPFQKATEANEAGVDFFISIHRNSSPLANQYMGVESLIYNLSGIKYEMAENINANLETVGFVNLGVKARPYQCTVGDSWVQGSRSKGAPKSGCPSPYKNAGDSGRSRFYQF